MHHMIARAQFHGRRLKAEGVALTPSLIGRLGYHEGADVTVAAMRRFSAAVTEAYNAN